MSSRKTVPDHARAAVAAIEAVLEGKALPPTVTQADLADAKRWLEKKLQPGGAWPTGPGRGRR